MTFWTFWLISLESQNSNRAPSLDLRMTFGPFPCPSIKFPCLFNLILMPFLVTFQANFRVRLLPLQLISGFLPFSWLSWNCFNGILNPSCHLLMILCLSPTFLATFQPIYGGTFSLLQAPFSQLSALVVDFLLTFMWLFQANFPVPLDFQHLHRLTWLFLSFPQHLRRSYLTFLSFLSFPSNAFIW